MAMFSSWFKSKPEIEPSEPPPEAPAAHPAEGSSGSPPPPQLSSVRTVKPNPVHAVRVSGPLARAPISLTSPPLQPAHGQPAYAAPKAPLPVVRAPEIVVPEPADPEAIVRLELGDFIDRVPVNFLKPGEVDRSQQIEFQVSELYSDLARGRASVPASVIYRKCPAIFARPVSETEDVEVHLPLHRLVEQMDAAFTPREDQTQEESVAEIETPFLQVAMEDNARLPKAPGTSVGATVRAVGLPSPLGARPSLPGIRPPTVSRDPEPGRAKQPSPISPIKQPVETPPLAAPTAQTASPINPSKRPPSTVRASVAGGKIRLSAPGGGGRDKPMVTPSVPHPAEAPADAAPPIYTPAAPRVSASSPSHQVTKKTARIQIPPISLRPASAGSPRPPTSADAAPAAPPPPSRAPEPLTRFKPTGKTGSPSSATPPTFRSTPPPPPSYVKPPPPSFSPVRAVPAPPPVEPPAAADAGLIEEILPVAPPAVASDRLIEMSLPAVLRGLPSTALVVEPTSVPESARLSLPFGLIEPQLSNGRVSIPLQTFREALPSAFSHVLAEDCDLAEVPIPLQEVFQNLPSEAISQRGDQIVEEARNSFPTPFAQKAEEDARRFAAPAPAPVEEPPAAPIEEKAPAPAPAAAEEEAPVAGTLADREEISGSVEPPAAGEMAQPEGPRQEGGDPLASLAPAPEAPPAPAPKPGPPPVAEPAREPALSRAADSNLQTLFMTEEELDAKAITRLASQLPGVESCSVMFGDGLLLAGSQPQDGSTEGFSAMAPALVQKVLNFTTELSLGQLEACTLYTEHGLLSLFTHGNICLTVRHSGRGFLPGVREKLVAVTRELAAMYAPAEPAAAADQPARN